MTDNVLYGIDFSAKRERDHAEFLLALSQAMAPDEVFVDPAEMLFGMAVRHVQYVDGRFVDVKIPLEDFYGPDKDSA